MSTSAWARAWRLARRKSTSPATPALRSTSKSATLSIATVFGSSSALDGYPNARNHAVALLSRCHRIYTTLRDLDVPDAVMTLLQFGCKGLAEIFGLEQGANLDFRFTIGRLGAAFHPFDGFLQGPDLP